jgi:hypothetical protein
MCCLGSETFTALDDFQLIRQHPARRHLIYFRGPIVADSVHGGALLEKSDWLVLSKRFVRVEF